MDFLDYFKKDLKKRREKKKIEGDFECLIFNSFFFSFTFFFLIEMETFKSVFDRYILVFFSRMSYSNLNVGRDRGIQTDLF